jgi:hypothetical protein
MRPSDEELLDQADTPLVYVHMQATRLGYPSYGRPKKVIRILKPEEGQWRDATPVETVAYDRLIDHEIDRELDELRRYPVYGIIEIYGRFRIEDNRPRYATETRIRSRHLGRDCTAILKVDLLDIAQQIGVPGRIAKSEMPDYDELVDEVATYGVDATNMTLDELAFYYGWLKSPKSDLCQAILDRLGELGHIYNMSL